MIRVNLSFGLRYLSRWAVSLTEQVIGVKIKRGYSAEIFLRRPFEKIERQFAFIDFYDFLILTLPLASLGFEVALENIKGGLWSLFLIELVHNIFIEPRLNTYPIKLILYTKTNTENCAFVKCRFNEIWDKLVVNLSQKCIELIFRGIL